MFESRLDRIIQRSLRRTPGDWSWDPVSRVMRCRDVAIEQLASSKVWVMHTGIGNVVLSSQSGRRLTELRETIEAQSRSGSYACDFDPADLRGLPVHSQPFA